MQYWDASALVPLCVDEPTSDVLRPQASRVTIVTWCLSSIEIASAIERRAREQVLDDTARAAALTNLRILAEGWTEVTAVAPVRDRALRVLATHALRAADALQLAAALVTFADAPAGKPFICTDQRLRAAAEREGFSVPAIAAVRP